MMRIPGIDDYDYRHRLVEQVAGHHWNVGLARWHSNQFPEFRWQNRWLPLFFRTSNDE